MNIYKGKLHRTFVVDAFGVAKLFLFDIITSNYLITIYKSVWHNFCKICISMRINRTLFNRKRCDIKRTLTNGKRISKNSMQRFLTFSDLSTQSIVDFDDVIYACMTNLDHHMLISNFSSNNLNLKRQNFPK